MGINSRQDMFAVHVYVDGNYLGIFDKMTGGDKDSEETKYKPGALGSAVSLGGSQTTNNVVVSRLYDGATDGPLLNGPNGLLANVGKVNMSVTKVALDTDGNPVGGVGLTYAGILKTCTPPEVDSESSSAAMLQLECSVATVA